LKVIQVGSAAEEQRVKAAGAVEKEHVTTAAAAEKRRVAAFTSITATADRD